MHSALYCYLSNSQKYPEFSKLGNHPDRLFLFYPKSEKEIQMNLPQNNEPNLLLFDPSTLALAGKETLTQLHYGQNFVMALVSGEDENDENIKFFNLSPHIRHLIPYKGKALEEEIEKLMQLLKSIQAKSKEDVAIDSIVSELENKKIHKLQDSQSRWGCYEELKSYVQKLKVFPDFSNIATTAASELITNAFYDAPKNPETGRSLNPDRKTHVRLAEPQKIEFIYGTRGDYLWLIVRDPFGSLDKRTVVASLLRAATERTALTQSEGGAGLGLKMVYEWASELVFSLSKGVSTTVACKLKLTRRHREFDSELASLHICETES
jgi:hypothetical protein